MAEARDDLGYPCSPRKISEFSWFYEERYGISVCHHNLGRTITIPWRKLEAAVDRHRKIKRRKKAK